MRLIDAEYLLYGMGMFSERENGAEFMKGVEAVSELICSADTIDADQNDGWIPCSERLPEDDDNLNGWYEDSPLKFTTVLVTGIKRGGTKKSVGPANRLNSRKTGNEYLDAYATDGWIWSQPWKTVLAWRPMPEPWKGEE